ncbi:unnamed protein product, partial [Laminaria digitata]
PPPPRAQQSSRHQLQHPATGDYSWNMDALTSRSGSSTSTSSFDSTWTPGTSADEGADMFASVGQQPGGLGSTQPPPPTPTRSSAPQ